MVVKRRLVRIVAFAVVFGLLGPSFALARGEYRAEPLGSFAADNAPSAGDETGVQVLESSAEGIVLELTTSEFAVEPGTADELVAFVLVQPAPAALAAFRHPP